MHPRLLLLLPILLIAPKPSPAESPKTTDTAWVKPVLAAVDAKLETGIAKLIEEYTQFHRNPELSLQEVKSAAKMAEVLRELGFTVTEKVGGNGVVGVLKNGPGPTVLVRADMDGLPVTEQTGAAYASTVRTKDREGQEVGVMHACGHDIHMTCWIGTARVLVSLKEQWSGTLV
jgi:metal-dependent amidase/aminoacylase/carboxypeptidase family protein